MGTHDNQVLLLPPCSKHAQTLSQGPARPPPPTYRILPTHVTPGGDTQIQLISKAPRTSYNACVSGRGRGGGFGAIFRCCRRWRVEEKGGGGTSTSRKNWRRCRGCPPTNSLIALSSTRATALLLPFQPRLRRRYNLIPPPTLSHHHAGVAL